MPEGDTIHFAAERIRPVLANRALLAADSPRGDVATAPLVGRRVNQVVARGKHLLIHTESGPTIHSHLGMTGSWRTASPGAPFPKPDHQASLLLTTEAGRVACFFPKLLRLLAPDAWRRDGLLAALGPDLLAGDWKEGGEALRKGLLGLQARPHLALGVAIMDQRAVCGVGNVYKSEVLFQCGFNPLDATGRFSDEELARVLRSAHEAMRRNVSAAPRRTRRRADGSRHWVYRRGGLPCLKCGDRIQMTRQGDLGRSTYWCPCCQPRRTAAAPDRPAVRPTEGPVRP